MSERLITKRPWLVVSEQDSKNIGWTDIFVTRPQQCTDQTIEVMDRVIATIELDSLAQERAVALLMSKAPDLLAMVKMLYTKVKITEGPELLVEDLLEELE